MGYGGGHDLGPLRPSQHAARARVLRGRRLLFIVQNQKSHGDNSLPMNWRDPSNTTSFPAGRRKGLCTIEAGW